MPRHDFYAPIHKGLRFALSNLLVRLAQTDFEDDAGLLAVLAALRQQMMLSAKHLHHEDMVVHTALESWSASSLAVDPGARITARPSRTSKSG